MFFLHTHKHNRSFASLLSDDECRTGGEKTFFKLNSLLKGFKLKATKNKFQFTLIVIPFSYQNSKQKAQKSPFEREKGIGI